MREWYWSGSSWVLCEQNPQNDGVWYQFTNYQPGWGFELSGTGVCADETYYDTVAYTAVLENHQWAYQGINGVVDPIWNGGSFYDWLYCDINCQEVAGPMSHKVAPPPVSAMKQLADQPAPPLPPVPTHQPKVTVAQVRWAATHPPQRVRMLKA